MKYIVSYSIIFIVICTGFCFGQDTLEITDLTTDTINNNFQESDFSDDFTKQVLLSDVDTINFQDIQNEDISIVNVHYDSLMLRKEKRDIRKCLRIATKLSKSGNNSEAVNKLDSIYRLYYEKNIVDKLKEIILNVNDLVMYNDTIDYKYYLTLLGGWTHDFSDIKDSLNNVLVNYYQKYDSCNDCYKEKLEISSKLHDLYPDNQKYSLLFLKSSGKLAKQNKNLDKAFTFYWKYLNIEEDQEIFRESKKLFKSAVQEYYIQKQYNAVYQFGTLYQEYIDNFDLHYYFTISAYKMLDFNKSITSINWIVNNWSDQNLITWEDALTHLLKCYISIGYTNKSLSLAERLYKETLNDEFIHYVLLSKRLEIILPAIKSLEYILKIEPDKELSFEVYPEFIYNIVYTDEGNIKKYYLGNEKIESKTINSFNKYKNYPAILDNKDGTIIVERLNTNNYIAITISRSIFSKESDYIKSIVREPLKSKYWNALYKSYSEDYLRFVTTCINDAFITGIRNESHFKLNSFGKLFSKTIDYLAFHDIDGLNDSYNFTEQNKINYDQVYWTKSSRTAAYMSAEIVDNDQKIIETVAPYFDNNLWKGALRIGYKNKF